MRADPKVSVVLCTYNGVAFVGEQLRSILAQTYEVDELLISDDSSTDSTLDVVYDIVRRYSGGTKVTIWQNPVNLGFIANFGKAIDRASGDIVFLSDQDDVWFQDKVQVMVDRLRQNDELGVVFHDALIIDRDAKVLPQTMCHAMKWLRQPIAPVRRPGIYGCVMAFRSDLRQYFAPIPTTARWPHDYWIYLIGRMVSQIGYVERPLMYYRRHGGNTSNNPRLQGSLRTWISLFSRTGKQIAMSRDRISWEYALPRLEELLAREEFGDSVRERLTETIEDIHRFLPQVCERERIKGLRVFRRLAPVYRLMKRGYYHRYHRGAVSAFKELIML